jgi:hypothetical protein
MHKILLKRKGTNPSLSPNIPTNMMLAHISLENVIVPSDIDPVIRKNEIAYTWYWLDMVVRLKWRTGVDRSEAEFLSNVGKRGDDAVVVSWSSQGVDFDIVDSRSLMVAISLQAGFKATALDIFKRFVAFDRSGIPDLIKASSELIGKEGDLASWGKIHVDLGLATGWFNYPIEWYQTEDTLVLVFDKSLQPAEAKAIFKAEKLFGGASIDDPVPYLRFKNSNRREHAELRLRQMGQFPMNLKEGDKDAVKGEIRWGKEQK